MAHNFREKNSRASSHKSYVQDPADPIAVSVFLEKYKLLNYDGMDVERLKPVDAIELMKTLQILNDALANTCIENHVLIEFFERTDAKLLLGIQNHIGPVNIKGQFHYSDGLKEASSRSSSQGSKDGRHALEHKLNYKAKVSMTQSSSMALEKKIKETEKSAFQEIKLLQSHLDDLLLTNIEILGTIKNFKLHFLGEEEDVSNVDALTERQAERKLRKWFKGWHKSAITLKQSMNLRISSLNANCFQLKTDLVRRADLAHVLTPPDLMLQEQRRNDLTRALEVRNIASNLLKIHVGRTALDMTLYENKAEEARKQLEKVRQEIVDTVKQMAHMQDAANKTRRENANDMLVIQNLKDQSEKYSAPSLSDYQDLQLELKSLEKEEAIQMRKNRVLKIKLDNIIKAANAKRQSYVKKQN